MSVRSIQFIGMTFRYGLAIAALAIVCQTAEAQPIISRVKDVAKLDGVQDNPLIGYGLVAGLGGTGDGRRGFTAHTLNNLMASMGINVLQPDVIDTEIIPDNVASVMVMANLPAFARPGQRVDATVVSIGRAESLQGGYLITTPLKGADGEFYGLAYGPVSIGGFVVSGGGGPMVQQNHTVVGVIPRGVIVEGEPVFHDVLQEGNVLRWLLHQPDFKTASNLQSRINGAAGRRIAVAEDAGAVRVSIGLSQAGQIVLGERGFDSLVDAIAYVDDLQIETDQPARIVINERTGTIVAGRDIRVHPAVIAHGPLRITIQHTPQVTPGIFEPGIVTEQIDIDVQEGDEQIAIIEGTTVGEVVEYLNRLGYTPRDLIAILEAMAYQGALRAVIDKM